MKPCIAKSNYVIKSFANESFQKLLCSGSLSFVFIERYIWTFLGCAMTAGGTYLFVTFGPNSHEKLNAENIVKHVISWPFLLYLVIHTPTYVNTVVYSPNTEY